MATLFLTSSAPGAGKTGIAAGLARHMLSENKKVGYLKAVLGTEPHADNDAAVMQRLLGLEESLEVLSPRSGDGATLKADIVVALARVSPGRDAIIIEGPSGNARLAAELASATGAEVIGVEAFASDAADRASYYAGFGARLAGIILNMVPKSRLAQAQDAFASRYRGTRLLGVVPEERIVAGVSVAELAEDVEGRIVSGAQGADAVVENIMLSAMSPDHGPEYYSGKEKKAVVVRSERPDMQLAALETPTTCLVLAGKGSPVPMVLRRAEAKRVPIVSTAANVGDVVARIEAGLRASRLGYGRAVAMAKVVEKSLDLRGILGGLGLAA